VEEEFVMPVKGGAQVRTRDTLVKAAMLELAERWPESIHFDQLLAASKARTDAENARHPTDGSELADALLAFYRAGLIDLQTVAPKLAAQVSGRPVLSAIARWQLANGSADVTNLRHHTVRFDDPIAIQLMLLLDGTSDRAAIVQELARFCREHRLLRDAEGSAIRDRPTLASLLDAGLGENLQKLARRCLLVA
jgi:methyltransferase-like protein